MTAWNLHRRLKVSRQVLTKLEVDSPHPTPKTTTLTYSRDEEWLSREQEQEFIQKVKQQRFQIIS